MKQLFGKIIFLLIFVVFFITRLIVLADPPYSKTKGGYSDVKQDYERYANIWWYGLPPYLKYLYEYPPGTIPFVILPLFLDQKGFGKYYPNYRAQIFLIETLFFIFLLYFLNKLKIKNVNKLTAVIFYIAGGFIAKDFLYDGIDTLFAVLWASSLMLFYLLKEKKAKKMIFFWVLYAFSISVKLINVSLLPFYFFLDERIIKKGKELYCGNLKTLIQRIRLNLKKIIAISGPQILSLIFGFLIVWGLPLIIFRSSLRVFLVYNLRRSFKYCSFPYYLVETINDFTKTEKKIDLAPDFSLSGPYSAVILRIFNCLLPLSIILIIIYGILQLIKVKKINLYLLSLKVTLIYLSTFFIVSKVYSQPFPIWLIPIISIFPFDSFKKQVSIMLFASALLVIDTTNLFNFGLFGYKIFIYPLTFGFIRHGIKFLVMGMLLNLSFKLPIAKKLKP